ncbi:MAG: class I SAM-dependent methyltransferase [Gammaproteobacteria bacterium]|nr:class I SAM-dependent methyltransferase [Gammaproteobacteria bacterium]
MEWKARYNGFLHANSVDLERLRNALKASHNSETGRRRISKLLQAREQYRDQITDILAPLELEAIDWPADTTNQLHGKVPKNQGLSSYSSNIFRDWAWNNGENEALIEAVDKVLSPDLSGRLGPLLTLGAGASRLPYDMHRRYSPYLSVILDINPLLMQVASHVIQGETVSLYEFPLAPLNETSFSVLQECRAPVPLGDENFHYVLADALNPPFARESFNTIVTPWLIDIIPQNLREFIPRINRILPQGGVWINTGSLAFFHRDETWCYSEEEVLELAVKNGFEIIAAERRTVTYLQSPHSAHGRTEKILSFSARKVRDVDPGVTYSHLPGWILDASQPIPSSTECTISSSNHMLTAQVLAAIDGKRTINQIGQLVASQYGLGTAETVHAVRRILVDAWEDSSMARTDWSK